jgi:hypothetical protein
MYSILGDQPSTVPHRGFKQHALAGEQLKSMLLTLIEKEVESCEQVIFSPRMIKKIIQSYFDVALDVFHQNDEHRLQMLRGVSRSM